MALPHQQLFHPPLSFPPHNAPRVWLIHPGHTSLVTSLSRHLLEHGDHVVLAISKTTITRDPSSQGAEFGEFVREMQAVLGLSWRERLRIVDYGGSDGIVTSAQAQSLVTSAIGAFGRVDILLCGPVASTLVAGVADLCYPQTTALANTLVRGFFESAFFSALHVVRAILPAMQSQGVGHVLVLCGASGVPGLGVHAAAGAALESWTEALGLEVAEFGIRASSVIVGPEVSVLCGSVTQLRGSDEGGAFEKILGRLASTDDGDEDDDINAARALPSLNVKKYSSPLSAAHRERVFAEVVHALVAIGGHENPPTRLVVGADGVADVKEKVKMMEEELDEFEECSITVDRMKSDTLGAGDLKVEAEREGRHDVQASGLACG